ncbi:hypothetical protein T440DRAFT_464217 [Plenodomus tracheiphilus IPT5]|uniref:Uncharacterized protein n=1 Tax=Plenodomus tracheiphilus IPT5 TaxID=1408161 RepID=A0A6A7BKF2_9PLEO|nr:hypothetical protein T440DRAFT_464217 [Plenodomus tracheiphilus IPT5]
MPSIFSKFGKKSNPYMDTQRFDVEPIPQVTSTQTTTASTTPSHPIKHLRPVSPQGAPDLLADARLVAGRDPVTGRRRPDLGSLTASDRAATEREFTEHLKELEERKRIAYQSHATVKNSLGERFDRFVKNIPAKRYTVAKAAAARQATEPREPVGNGLEYYAPTRTINEYYAGGIR